MTHFCTLPNVIRLVLLTSVSQKILAWSVHLFTASGLIFAFLSIIAIDKGNWSEAFLWLVVCFVVDGLDGTFARKFNVADVIPSMDGKYIDYVIDFTTYAVIPAIFFYKANMTTDYLMMPAICLMLLSSGLYYGKKNMVADGQYFVGFPVLWNFVVFFQFFVCGNIPLLNFWSVVVISIMHFIPIRYAYPSQTKRFFWSHLIVSVAGLTGAIFLLFNYPNEAYWMKVVVALGGAYFIGFAVFDTMLAANKSAK